MGTAEETVTAVCKSPPFGNDTARFSSHKVIFFIKNMFNNKPMDKQKLI